MAHTNYQSGQPVYTDWQQPYQFHAALQPLPYQPDGHQQRHLYHTRQPTSWDPPWLRQTATYQQPPSYEPDMYSPPPPERRPTCWDPPAHRETPGQRPFHEVSAYGQPLPHASNSSWNQPAPQPPHPATAAANPIEAMFDQLLEACKRMESRLDAIDRRIDNDAVYGSVKPMNEFILDEVVVTDPLNFDMVMIEDNKANDGGDQPMDAAYQSMKYGEDAPNISVDEKSKSTTTRQKEKLYVDEEDLSDIEEERRDIQSIVEDHNIVEDHKDVDEHEVAFEATNLDLEVQRDVQRGFFEDLHVDDATSFDHQSLSFDDDLRWIPPCKDTSCSSILGRLDKLSVLTLNFGNHNGHPLMNFYGGDEGRCSTVRCAFDPGGDILVGENTVVFEMKEEELEVGRQEKRQLYADELRVRTGGLVVKESPIGNTMEILTKWAQPCVFANFANYVICRVALGMKYGYGEESYAPIVMHLKVIATTLLPLPAAVFVLVIKWKKVMEGVRSLIKGGATPQFTTIDDGWKSVDMDPTNSERACVTYCIADMPSYITKHSLQYKILMVGSNVGGTATSFLFSPFESWLVAEYLRKSFEQQWLSLAFSKAIFLGNILVAMDAGFLINMWVDLGHVSTFNVAAIFLASKVVVVLSPWTEDYGNPSESKDLLIQIKSYWDAKQQACVFDPGGDTSQSFFYQRSSLLLGSHLEDKVDFNRGGVDTSISTSYFIIYSIIKLAYLSHIISFLFLKLGYLLL